MKHLIGFAAAIALLVLAVPQANAAFYIAYQVNAGPVTVCSALPDAGGDCVVGSVGGTDVSITKLTGTSNSPGGPQVSLEIGDDVLVTAGSNDTVHVWFYAQDFTFPAGPKAFDAINLTINPQLGSGTVDLNSCVDANGTTPPSYCVSPFANTPVPLNGTAFSGATSVAANTGTGITALTTPFELAQELTINFGANGGIVEARGSQTLTPAPEPASVLLFGGLLLGVTTLVRKKVARRS